MLVVGVGTRLEPYVWVDETCVLTFALAPGILRPRRDGISGARNQASLASLDSRISGLSSHYTALKPRFDETNQRLSLLFFLFHCFHILRSTTALQFSILFSTIRKLYSRTHLRNFTAAIKSPSLPEFPFETHNLAKNLCARFRRTRERKRDTKEGRDSRRGPVVRALQLGGAYLSNVGLLTLGPWPAKSLSS